MSDQLYDRHYYIVHFKDGRDFKFDDYELMRSWWMKHSHQGQFSHVTVHNNKKKKSRSSKGFGD